MSRDIARPRLKQLQLVNNMYMRGRHNGAKTISKSATAALSVQQPQHEWQADGAPAGFV
jgi:hypothetical protein